jgi:hypothetical protein
MKRSHRWSLVVLLVAAQALLVQASSFAQHTGYYSRPIPMGVSISTTPTTPYIAAGTAGILVQSVSDPSKIYILSNNHVLGAIGPTLCPNTAPAGTAVLQPGTIDIGYDPGANPTYQVGELYQYIRVKLRYLSRNTVDAAIATTDTDHASSYIEGIGYPSTTIGQAAPGEAVTKSGRTTGVTTGTVQSVNTTVYVNYSADPQQPCSRNGGVARFINQVVIGSGFSDSGDSGSAILDSATKQPVALLFAGSSTDTVGNPFDAVASAFNVVPVGAPGAAPSGVAMGNATSKTNPELERLKAIQERNEEEILGIEHVAGIGIGLSPDGKSYQFIVYCEKLSKRLQQQVPKQLEGVPVQLKVSGPFVAY